MTSPERHLLVADPGQRKDLRAFVERALRLDDAAVVRLRERRGGLVGAWVSTGFEVLASRVVAGQVRPADLSAGADALALGLASATPAGVVDPGFPMDSAWRGALPPEDGFVHLEDVPAQVMLELAQRGGALARQHSSAHGPPSSLLDQDVVAVSAPGGDVGVPMRCVFALTAMGFVPGSGDAVPADEVVRVRVLPSWLRLDARFGSVYRRRGGLTLITR